MTAQNRIQRYLDMREAKPMPQLGDGIHCVNPGTEFEGTLALSDLRELSSQHREMLGALERIAEIDRESYSVGEASRGMDDIGKIARAAIAKALGQ